MTTQTFSVPSISCEHCVNAITGEVTKVAGVDAVTVDVDTKTVTVVGAASQQAIVAAIDEAGYDVAD
jgi:copper ion binding protein